MSSSLVVLPLRCPYQTYDWGKLGSSSEVAQLASLSSIDQTLPYAELWMGTHSTAPSTIKGSSQLLRDVLGSDLPFLFKVLSINRALSIQAHPDLLLAPQLHKQNPKEYRDANHKPELACAVTPFEAMCGFRSSADILYYLTNVPELRTLVGDSCLSAFSDSLNNEETQKQGLKQLFTAVMTASKDQYIPLVRSLIIRLTSSSLLDTRPSRSSRDLDVYDLCVRLSNQYPDDIGIFAPFLLNCFRCSPGESIFLAANEPHAYLSGDIIEVMACSDNVVRAGLTSKFRDVEILCSMLNYKMGEPVIDNAHEIADGACLFPAPVPEFKLTRYFVKANSSVKPLKADSHSIILIYSGSGSLTEHSNGKSHSIERGSILLIPAGCSVELSANENDSLLVFRCSANDEFNQKQ
jgi:mannose-6-phosphate isomerase